MAGLTVRVECPLYPSEDPAKVARALDNLFPGLEFELSDGVLRAESDRSCLDELRGNVRRRRVQASLARQMRKNERDGRTWFYLNKQAAFMGTAAVCENADESPLGPVRVSLPAGDWLSEGV